MIIFAFLPLSVFFLLWILLIARQSLEGDGDFHLQEAFIRAGLFWSAFLALSTEILSLLQALTTAGVVILWSFALLVMCIYHLRFKSFNIGWARIQQRYKSLGLDWLETILIVVIVTTLVILLITAVMSPPNIHDVLTYHMSRVMHWVQNRSLVFFPTSITWQLWYPPFSEFSQLHWQLLVGSDTLSAFHQWYSLVMILVVVMAIAKRIGAQRRGEYISAFFILSLPIVVLQASGGKNDIVLTFFFMALAYFVIKAAYQPLIILDWISASLACGFGVMTKGNFVFFALPLLIWLFVLMLKKAGWKKTLAFAAMGMLVVGILNGAHWVRNTVTFGTPTNSADASFIMNARFGLDVLLSNLSRNTALQLSSVSVVNQFIEDLLARLHTWIGIPLFDTATTLGPKEFLSMPTREEVAGNPIHFGIIGLVMVGLTVKAFGRKNRPAVWTPLLLALSAITGMVLFSSVFRWQAWGTRYFIFYYALFAPVLGYLVDLHLPRWAAGLITLVLVVVMVNPLLNNYSRSFSWSDRNRNSIWRMSRRGLRFANHQIYEGAILEMTHLMEVSGCRTYGMSIGGNSPEYLIWGTLTPDARDYHLAHIGVDNPSVVHASEDFDPCGIIVFEAAPPELVVEGDYLLLEGWQLEGYEGLPVQLYLRPDLIPQGLE